MMQNWLACASSSRVRMFYLIQLEVSDPVNVNRAEIPQSSWINMELCYKFTPNRSVEWVSMKIIDRNLSKNVCVCTSFLQRHLYVLALPNFSNSWRDEHDPHGSTELLINCLLPLFHIQQHFTLNAAFGTSEITEDINIHTTS